MQIKSHQKEVIAIWVILLLVLIAFGGSIKSSLFSRTEELTPTPDYSTWRNYTNEKSGVSLKYPATFALKPGQIGPKAEWTLRGLSNGIEIFSVEILRSFQSRTNFGGASLRMGSSNNQIEVNECLRPQRSFDYVNAYSQRSIGGVVFKKFMRSEVGAGNYYDFTSYRALRNGECNVFEYVINHGDIQNYPAESKIKEYNPSALVGTIESILDTVQFLK